MDMNHARLEEGGEKGNGEGGMNKKTRRKEQEELGGLRRAQKSPRNRSLLHVCLMLTNNGLSTT